MSHPSSRLSTWLTPGCSTGACVASSVSCLLGSLRRRRRRPRPGWLRRRSENRHLLSAIVRESVGHCHRFVAGPELDTVFHDKRFAFVDGGQLKTDVPLVSLQEWHASIVWRLAEPRQDVPCFPNIDFADLVLQDSVPKARPACVHRERCGVPWTHRHGRFGRHPFGVLPNSNEQKCLNLLAMGCMGSPS